MRTLHLSLTLALCLSACGGGSDPDPVPVVTAPPVIVPIACEQLVTAGAAEGATITAARVVVPAAGSTTPQYCRVEGTLSAETGSSIKFATNIPMTGWTGRFMMMGNGGYAGGNVSTTTNFLSAGYATAMTDTGHTATAGTAFFNNRPVEIDYGYRAIHLVTNAAKALIKANQGKAPEFSYFNGCSTGGRQALMEVQRFPDDFDGVLAGSPAAQLVGGIAIEQNWSLRKFFDNNFAGNIFGKTAALTAAAKAACADAEGVFSNPACTFDPDVLACPVGVDNATCLTPPQLTAVKEVYRGPHSSTGISWYEGKPVGSEAAWSSYIVANSANPATWNPGQGGFGFSFVNNLFFEVDPPSTYNWYDFNFDVDPPKKNFMAQIIDSVDPDITKFIARKGKLIVYHGTGDGLIGYQGTERYMENVHRLLGSRTVDANARLFIVHGMDHCDGADRGGLTVTDWMAPLVKWVEGGSAPDSIPGKSRATNPLQFTRPICAYPKIAAYSGAGSRLDAANWSCTL